MTHSEKYRHPHMQRAILARCRRTPTSARELHRLIGGSIHSVRHYCAVLAQEGHLERMQAHRAADTEYLITPDGALLLERLQYTPEQRQQRMQAAARALAKALGYPTPRSM